LSGPEEALKGDLDEQGYLRSIEALLGVVARHANLLGRDAFDEFAATLEREIGCDQLSFFVWDGPGFLRLYASSVHGGTIAHGQRVPFADHPAYAAVFEQGVVYRCDDTSKSSHPLDQLAIPLGILSYVSIPVRSNESGRTLGSLVLQFRHKGGVPASSLRLGERIAQMLGPNVDRAVPLARERRLAMILETSGDAMLAWDHEGRITDANDAAACLTNVPKGELIGLPVRDVLHPQPDTSRPNTPAQGVRLELRARAAEATPARRVTVAATVTSVEDDAHVAAHALLRDLSEVVATEREAALHLARIRELEEQHRKLLDNAPLIIFRLDPITAELVYLNRHAERLLGVPTSEALATPGFLRSAHADPAVFDAAIARARARGELEPYEARMRHRDGEEITVRGAVYPLASESGELDGIEGVLADVSVEHAARTRLVQADRLSTLGMLSAGVAHEINNPAAFILLGLDMLGRLLGGAGVKMESAVAANAHELLRELRDSIKRIVDIARDLRLFASPPSQDPLRRTVVDVNRTVESALTLTRGQIIERAQIERDIDNVPPVLMDDGRLGQVVVNLLVNAAQAIPKTIARDNSISIATRSDGRTVEITVTDTGVGIAKEDLARIWTPFFTTKSPDVGTGLGLSISREIVERAGGRIDVVSPVFPGDTPYGSSFTIVLPAAGRGDTVPPISSPLPRTATSKARVLVVEDEASLARALADEIGRTHEVMVAPGAEQALAYLAVEKYDVVLCDLRMPGMSGEALYTEIEARDPHLANRFVFMTGVGFGADVERFLSNAGRPVLEKPFSTEEALTTLAKVIARASRRT
jgi:PAS domain S-box-containing protein